MTCGIYHLYWAYTAGEKLDAVRHFRGLPVQSNGVVYLLLSLFDFSVVAWALMQNELNRMSGPGPVSYTHLDVYKRQGRLSRPAVGFFAVTSAIRLEK